MIAPGIVYLAGNALRLGIPLACAATVVRQLTAVTLDIVLPAWLLISVSCASLPVFAALRLTIKHLRHRREAAAIGARLAPVGSRGRWPGNLDLVIEFQKISETGYPGDGLRDVLEEVGPVVNLRPLWTDIILTTEPRIIKLILATDFHNYVKGERFQFGMSSVLGVKLTGDMWKFHRTLSRPFFSRDRISHFDIFNRHADDVISLLKERMKAGYAVDFQDLIGRFTMDSATEFLFGSCVNSLHASLPFPHNATFTTPESDSARARAAMEFSAAFNESMLRIANRARIGWAWPLVEMWFDKTAEPMKIVSAYIDPIIHEAIEKKKLADSLHGATEKTDLEDEMKEGATLLDELLNVTSAGKDTTQWMTTVIVYFLAIYPKINARLRQEVLERVGRDRRPTYDDIRDMKFLRAVINEAMRLYPSVECIDATTWPSPNPNEKPIYIPAGTQVPYSVLLLHRRKDLWGPDAEEFDPDRWLDERLKTYLLADSFKFLPFNAGPRICLGQQWAGLEGRKGVVKIHPKIHLTMYSKGGLWLKMTEV
ncbi:cytochrome P450 [Mycena filopes]|nr:cytochrome P450 [Mycena filopes]